MSNRDHIVYQLVQMLWRSLEYAKNGAKKEIKKKKLEVVSKLKSRLMDTKDETQHNNRSSSTTRKNNDNCPAATKIRNEEEKSLVCHCEVLYSGAQVSDQDNREARKVHELRRREVPDQDAVR